MAPHIRSYSKRNATNSSSTASSKVLSENVKRGRITKKNKAKKICIKELPPPDKNVHISNDSLQVETDDTFDKLRNGSIYNPVELKAKSVFNITSDSDLSKSKLNLPVINIMNSVYSPIMTRRKRKLKGAKIAEEKSPMKIMINDKLCSSDSLKTEVPLRTLDKSISYSLEMEPERKNDQNSSLNFTSVSGLLQVSETRDSNVLFKPIFSKTFRDKVHRMPQITSTPNNIINASLIPAIVEAASPVLPRIHVDNVTLNCSSEKKTNGLLPHKRLLEVCRSEMPSEGKLRKKLDLTSNNEMNKSMDEILPTSDIFLGFNTEDQNIASLQASIAINEETSILEEISHIHVPKVPHHHFIGFGSEDEASASIEPLAAINEETSILGEMNRINLPKVLQHSTPRDASKRSEELRSSTVHNSSIFLKNETQFSLNKSSELYSGSHNLQVEKSNDITNHLDTCYEGTSLQDNTQNITDLSNGRTKLSLSTQLSPGIYITLRNRKVRSKSVISKTSNLHSDLMKANDKENVSNEDSKLFQKCFVKLKRTDIPQFMNKLNDDKTTSEDSKLYKNCCAKLNTNDISQFTVELNNDVNDRKTHFSEINSDKTTNFDIQTLADVNTNGQNCNMDSTKLFQASYVNLNRFHIEEGINNQRQIRECPELSDFNEGLSGGDNDVKADFTQSDFLQESISDSCGSDCQIVDDAKSDVESSRIEKKSLSYGTGKISDESNKSSSDMFDSYEDVSCCKDVKLNTEYVSVSSANDDSVFIKPTIIPSHVFQAPKRLSVLKPGKLWRRSLSVYKTTELISEANEINCTLEKGCSSTCMCINCKQGRILRRSSVRIVPVRTSIVADVNITALENYAANASYASDTEKGKTLEETVRKLSVRIRDSLIINNTPPVTARDIILRKCLQTEPLSFEECYTEKILRNCRKIGEGVYGEVFLYRNQNGGTSVMKVIPIEGTLMVNGDRQKKFEEIISEIVIATELSNLRNNRSNQTSIFSEVQNVKCVKGRYPEKLLDLWNLYDEDRNSENDSPEVFGDDQLYIVLELADGGKDLESYVFVNAQQSYALLKQISCALAVAETVLQFEHRDLHWGNVLIKTSNKNKNIPFCLDDTHFEIETQGVEACVIDFTLSRITHDGVIIFNDLGQDEELFTASGDYQFEIYKLMQKHNGNEWSHFEPYSNILWLHYVIEKMVNISGIRYRNKNTKIHKIYMDKLLELKDTILTFDSVKSLVTNLFL